MRIAISGEAETSLVVPFLLAADLGGYISGALAAAPGQNNCKLPSSVALIDQWTTVCGATAPDVAKVDGTLGWPWVGETAEQTGTAPMYTVPVLVLPSWLGGPVAGITIAIEREMQASLALSPAEAEFSCAKNTCTREIAAPGKNNNQASCRLTKVSSLFFVLVHFVDPSFQHVPELVWV